jgi:carboxypeptidase C (cathepsin A)
MGILETALKKAIKKQIDKRFKPVSKSKRTNSREYDLAMREIREKQELADRMKTQAKLQSQQLLKIANDCAELVNTTVNPEVFFMRYNLMLENLEKLVGLECTGIFENSAELPSVAFSRIEAQFTAATNDFLERSFEKAKEHAETLKTESGKTNAIKRYFDNMEKYIINMSSESLEHFDKMKETYLKGNN